MLVPYEQGEEYRILDGDELFFAEGYEDVRRVWECLSPSYAIPLNEALPEFDAYVKKLSDYAMTLCYMRDGEIAGAVSFYANDTHTKAAYISQIAVQETYKRCGIGSRLIDIVCREARCRMMKTIGLEVLDDNVAAQVVYKSLGFSYTGQKGSSGSIMTKAL